MGKMALNNGVETKGEVHWIITYDNDNDVHYVECPTTPMEFGEDGEIVSGNTWGLSVLTKGSFGHCVDFIRSISQWDDHDYREGVGYERPEDMEED